MKTKLYTLGGKEHGEIELLDEVFGVDVRQSLIQEVFVAQNNNQREPWADTKNRGEVRGGGRKPWAQKGTGRARHGSIRSPIWKGGGVTFGPLSIRNYKTKINKKTRRLAIRMSLTDRAQNESLIVLEDFQFSAPKTKVFAELLANLPVKQRSYLVLTPGLNDAVRRMTENLKNVSTMRAEDVNVMEVINHSAIITSVDGIKMLEKVFAEHKA